MKRNDLTDEAPCRLCGGDDPLQHSHIFPAFIFRWLIKTGGPIRFAQRPNIRAQDGPKDYWLCRSCETRFSRWETKFASQIFYPVSERGPHLISYDDWLLKFCVSVSWRTLQFITEQARPSHLSNHQIACLDKALHSWREFLLGNTPHPHEFEQHLILLDAIESASGFKFPPNINRYFLRGVEMDIGANNDTAFVYSKFGRVIILGFICLKKKEWPSTKVHVKHGSVGTSAITLPSHFGRYLVDRAERSWDQLPQLSPNQQKKAEERFLRDLEQIRNSDMARAMQLDRDMFGDRAFRDFQKKKRG